MEGLRVAIIGGSIGGLSAAVALQRLGASVAVFEKSQTPFHGRGGSLGFCHVPLWQQLRGARMLRRGVQASRAQGAFLYGDLWAFWEAALPPGTIRYGATVEDLGDPAAPTVLGEQFDLAVVADGGWSALRARYFDQRMPAYAGYVVYRFRVPRDKVPGWAAEGMYESALGAPYATILMHIAADNGFGRRHGTAPASEDAPTHSASRTIIRSSQNVASWFQASAAAAGPLARHHTVEQPAGG